MNVLIVDDNRSVRRVIRDLVAPFAENIYECGDGQTAIEFYRRFHPDWVLLDINLPQIDGLTATRLIIDEDAQAKILIITSYDEPEMRKAAAESGAKYFIPKDDLSSLGRIFKNHQT